MKNLCSPEIAKWRNHEADAAFGMNDEDRAYGGAFEVPFRNRGTINVIWLRVLASRDDGQGSGMGWDHVSVSTQVRCPTWEEMEFVKRLFFEDGETAMQLHVPLAIPIGSSARRMSALRNARRCSTARLM
jgi:hypothetical protein